jgi:hypothetical protein
MSYDILEDLKLLPELESAVENLTEEEGENFHKEFSTILEEEFGLVISKGITWTEKTSSEILERAIEKTIKKVSKPKKNNYQKSRLDLL